MALYQLPVESHVRNGQIVDMGATWHRFGKVLKVLKENYKITYDAKGSITYKNQPVKLCLIAGIDFKPDSIAGYAWYQH